MRRLPRPHHEGVLLLYADENSADELEAVLTQRLDVDLEMAQMHAEADVWHAVRDRGFCNHGSAVGYLNPPVHELQKRLKLGELACTAGCETIFANDEDWYVNLDDPMLNPVPLPRRSGIGGGRSASHPGA
ncbi:hypothetical protein [Streptomyces violascens]|uniref:hypothetical protein n=1 Tax=Streptomyces violascens TaxID=67381 RepID=UPI0019A536C8|nr:hypothetical protein [Streptomyces violascens]GGU40582.1 hypothetical protein GCM10010289_71830 [Streptomyces violascens]